MNKFKKKLFIGIFIGTLAPFIAAFSLKYLLAFIPRFRYFNVITIADILKSSSLTSTFLQWGIIANLVIFFYFMQKNDQALQRGIVLPTLLFTLAAIILKFNA